MRTFVGHLECDLDSKFRCACLNSPYGCDNHYHRRFVLAHWPSLGCHHFRCAPGRTSSFPTVWQYGASRPTNQGHRRPGIRSRIQRICTTFGRIGQRRLVDTSWRCCGPGWYGNVLVDDGNGSYFGGHYLKDWRKLVSNNRPRCNESYGSGAKAHLEEWLVW